MRLIAAVELIDVMFAYRDSVVLREVSLKILPGDFCVLVGPNGAGKSTLLKLMAGLLVPQKGKVLHNGQDISDTKYTRNAAYVPQHYGTNLTNFPVTVEEAVTLGLLPGERFMRHNRKASRHIVAHMLELVGMGNFAERCISELSGGQRQRVMVAMALASNPSLLLLDEPTSGIDYEASEKIYQLLGDLSTNLGITIVMVSHDITRAVSRATKVACINGGLCFIGTGTDFALAHGQSPHLLYYQSQVTADCEGGRE